MGVGDGQGLCGKKILPAGVPVREVKNLSKGETVSPSYEFMCFKCLLNG